MNMIYDIFTHVCNYYAIYGLKIVFSLFVILVLSYTPQGSYVVVRDLILFGCVESKHIACSLLSLTPEDCP